MRRLVVFTFVSATLLLWQCSRNNGDMSLKSSVEDGAVKINKAMNAISATKGYELMAMSDMTKSGEGYSDSIKLEMISGIYNFMPDTVHSSFYRGTLWKFQKTGDSEMLVVNIPGKLIFHPRCLDAPLPTDTLKKNDFTLTASEYHYYFSFMGRYDYRLLAGFESEGEDIGTLAVDAAGATFADKSYSSEFQFNDNYSVKVSFERGDTAVKSFALMEGEEVLLSEERSMIWSNFRPSEWQYRLTVGDVELVRTKGIDSVQVYLNGVLQSSAAARVTEEGEGDGSVCHHRDLLLTFDDGTTVLLSDLIGPALDTLSTLTGSMHQMYFAKHVADYIALSIYFQKPQ